MSEKPPLFTADQLDDYDHAYLATLPEPSPAATAVLVNGVYIPADEVRAARRAAGLRQVDSLTPPASPSEPTSTITEPSPNEPEREKPDRLSVNEKPDEKLGGRGGERLSASASEVLEQITLIALAEVDLKRRRGASQLNAKMRALELLMDHHGLIGAHAARLPADRRAAIETVVRELQARGVKVTDRSIATTAKRLDEPPRPLPVVVEAKTEASSVMSTQSTDPKSLTSNEETEDVKRT